MNEKSCCRLEPAELNELRARLVHAAKPADSFKIENAARDPRLLSLEADLLLQHGYHRAAELLAHRAEELREVGR